MATHTKRDVVWSAALELATAGGAFSIRDVDRTCEDDLPSERTVRDVLTTMADEEWLAKDTRATDGKRLYRAGPRI